jgi:ribosomal protein S27AE
MNPLAYLWIINLLLIVDWAKNRRPTFWLVALIVFGPIGAVAYTIYFYEQINWPIELAKTVRSLTGKPALRPCPRCGTVAELKAHQDGRQTHFMCPHCIERTFLAPRQASEAVEAARNILQDTDH